VFTKEKKSLTIGTCEGLYTVEASSYTQLYVHLRRFQIHIQITVHHCNAAGILPGVSIFQQMKSTVGFHRRFQVLDFVGFYTLFLHSRVKLQSKANEIM